MHHDTLLLLLITTAPYLHVDLQCYYHYYQPAPGISKKGIEEREATKHPELAKSAICLRLFLCFPLILFDLPIYHEQVSDSCKHIDLLSVQQFSEGLPKYKIMTFVMNS